MAETSNSENKTSEEAKASEKNSRSITLEETKLENMNSEESTQTTESTQAQAAEAADSELSLQSELDAAKKEVESLKDSWARERAEFQNFKRRSAQEFVSIRKEAVKSLVSGFLNPIDNLERVGATQSPSEELKPFVEGVAMILKEFYAVLEKSNVIRFDPKGESFDPMSMEALSSEEGDQYSEETVIDVYQAGYYYKENEDKFTLRPARVRIGKPKS
ncbi:MULTISPECIES: nucleotide exchange factor GrpE [Leptospira]|uniref:Protein GrpE n=8 Tax=Leptospira borgpetersenii TaxID=174 RepID=GRPE_LEPBJ|nr:MULTISPECIES: nucleotide exchange factor GrpE [Leptospira]Q04VC9.1 RecName: Full=Protein GrpE; AltName: Full=HSP-70 cofactor [Leptospira borgpetersenii serovar Hardjo-bovis str. JB197]Q04Y46.1 RecName: Full=Protein GrpE; AltName: Full=HSP-70 cofactor [Leptospira borgpetersenii serovar Hardjo-bovis str. L550]EMF98542.1 co-chaperone GrpE [Leptospira borgpetersenii str. 200701203]EMO11932.1 co-chaperone GrpE [Leptospira borgpetersenii str. Noumea 25]ABJ75141.1 Chaperone protein, GrpE [Leptospi